MFECGAQVVYGMHGVCDIVQIESKKISGKTTEYYVLQPVDQPGAQYYVPTQNPRRRLQKCARCLHRSS